jgi:hypothetical protein
VHHAQHKENAMIKFTPPPATHVCANAECATREWNVTADTNQRDLWYLHGRKGEFTMASSKPACPICGENLLEIASLEPSFEMTISHASQTLPS